LGVRDKTGPDPGWRSYGPQVREETNCLGKPVEYRYDAAGARLHDGFDAQKTAVLIVGDLYTNGDEVNDNETYPARLSKLLGVSVANHGVEGYGPTQSLLLGDVAESPGVDWIKFNL